jgi:tRNA G10  N-methylase Trm11
VFFKKYLEIAREKHASHTEKVGGLDEQGKKYTAVRYQIELTKKSQLFEVVAGNTQYVNTYYKKNSFHAIVGDLPYGVQHGSKEKQGKQKSITRNAMGMLSLALPEWMKVLKPGGAVALAWNLFLISRNEMEDLFLKHGLIMPEETKDGFAHRVDQAINRDFIVGVKPV